MTGDVVELGKIADLVTKGTTPTTLGRPFVVNGINFVKAESIDVDGRIIARKLAKIDEETHRLLARSQLQGGDILFSIAGVIGRTAIVPSSLPPANTNQAIAIIRIGSNDVDRRFLYYQLRSDRFLRYSLGRVVQTAQANVSLGVLKRAPINLPDLVIQRKVADVLSSYDELIENNTRRIRILGEIAQTIYREWFIEFRFPGHADVSLVESELGPIPEGWRVSTLGEVLSVLESGSRPRGGIDPAERDVPSIGAENILGLGQYDFGKERYVSRAFFESMKKGHVSDGDVLLYKDGAQLGRKSLFRDRFPHVECAVNEHVFRMRTAGGLSQSSLYFWLDRPDVTQRVIDLNSNAAQPGVSQAKIKTLPVLLPDAGVEGRFSEIADGLLGLLFSLARSNRNLQVTRDLLLPRLIFSELSVSPLDIDSPGLVE